MSGGFLAVIGEVGVYEIEGLEDNGWTHVLRASAEPSDGY